MPGPIAREENSDSHVDDEIRVVVDGVEFVEHHAPPWLPLAEYLRDSLGLTGVKRGCGCGGCGACTVHLQLPDGPRLAALSCLLPLAAAHGYRVHTVHGENPRLAPAQAALHSHGAVQCGFCSPGAAMAMAADGTTPEQALQGHLCRCTGYLPLRNAAHSLRGGAWTEPTAPRRPVPFQYHHRHVTWTRPSSVAGLRALLAQHPDALLLAGATDLGQGTKRLREATEVVLLDGIAEICGVVRHGDKLRIGAATPLSWLMASLPEAPGALRDALARFATPSVRNLATVGGSLCTASPTGDLAPALLCLDTEAHILGANGERFLPLDDFLVGYRQTALQPGEVLAAVELVPPSTGALSRYHPVRHRHGPDVTILGLALTLEHDENGRVERARIALAGGGPTPARFPTAEQALEGAHLSEESTVRAACLLSDAIDPIDDHRASAEQRRALAGDLLRRLVAEKRDEPRPPLPRPRHRPNTPLVHPTPESLLHLRGEARFVADEPSPPRLLHLAVVGAPVARGCLNEVDIRLALHQPGVVTILTAGDLPGANECSPTIPGESILADGAIGWLGEPVAVVVADSAENARHAAELVRVHVTERSPVLGIAAAEAADSWHGPWVHLRQGDMQQAMAEAPHRIEGRTNTPSQEHLYLETQTARAIPGEDGAMRIRCATQHPTKVQQAVARTLGLGRHQIAVEVPRLGGAFGGKESQATRWACLAAVAAQRTRRPVQIQLERHEDLTMTGKRHPMEARWSVGFTDDGRLQALEVELLAEGGWAPDLSLNVMDRALLHLDNAYFIPHLHFAGRVARTNIPPNTACRGFGVPQAVTVMESIMDAVAEHLGGDPLEIRRRNLYEADGGQRTPWGGAMPPLPLRALLDKLEHDADLASLRCSVEQFNASQSNHRRSIAICPVRFGIGFSNAFSNQAGAYVRAFTDGTVQVSHGGVEMGQGLRERIRRLAAEALGITVERVRVMITSTEQVPNTSATAGSTGTDLNGQAVLDACRTLLERLDPIAKEAPEASFAELCQTAWSRRIGLAVTGFFQIPGMGFERAGGDGLPFAYHGCGAAMAVVEVDRLTGEWKLLRAHLLQDVGESPSQDIDHGQVLGGFVQGMGWATTERVLRDDDGALITTDPASLGVPMMASVPDDITVELTRLGTGAAGVLGSRAIGEPPFVLGVVVGLAKARAEAARA
jgi:xanthine dehydrogenase molybdopterin binding subunit